MSSMPDKPLTGQQQRVLAFVREFLEENGFPPTFREIGDAIGLASVNAVRGHLFALEKKGYITKTPDKARSIQIVHPPSALSRVQRRLHEVWGTDEGVFHRVVYGVAWPTHDRTPFLTGLRASLIAEAIEHEAVEHGWTVLDKHVEPDHVVVIVQTWHNHSAQRTVHRFQAAGNAVKNHHPREFPRGSLWGRGYVSTTDLGVLGELVTRLLDNQGKQENDPDRTS
jgi:SOS-response transcriptional repressor LexA